MLYDVYVLSFNTDPVDALRAGPKRGELIVCRRYTNSPDTSLLARLLDPANGAELLPGLMYARLVAMDGKGMVIEGTQTVFHRDTHKAKGHHFVQRWLCKTPGSKAVIDTEKLLKRSAVRLRSAAASGFDPADD